METLVSSDIWIRPDGTECNLYYHLGRTQDTEMIRVELWRFKLYCALFYGTSKTRMINAYIELDGKPVQKQRQQETVHIGFINPWWAEKLRMDTEHVGFARHRLIRHLRRYINSENFNLFEGLSMV